LLFVGEEDLEWRKHIIAGLFALNRRAGALVRNALVRRAIPAIWLFIGLTPKMT
jgi:hypothetical protein